MKGQALQMAGWKAFPCRFRLHTSSPGSGASQTTAGTLRTVLPLTGVLGEKRCITNVSVDRQSSFESSV